MASPTIPTLAETIQRVRNDFKSQTGADAFVRRNVEYVLSRVVGTVAKTLYSYITDRYQQAYYDTCTDENFWPWGARYGIEQTTEVAWKGTVTFTGFVSTSIPSGTALQRSDGQGYTTDVPAVVGAGGTVDVAVTGDTAGSASSNALGAALSLTSPIPGLDSDAVVASTTTDGSDPETRAQCQARLRARLASPWGAGNPGFYETTALGVSGVTRAWEFPGLDGAGTVPVAFARDADADPVPDSGERAEVESALVAAAPVTAQPSVLVVVAAPLDVTVSNLSPDTPTVRAAVETSLADLVVREGAPGGTITTSQIREAISAASGEVSHTLVSPAVDQVYTTLQLPTAGTLTVA